MKKVDIRAVIKLDYSCNSRCLFCHRGEERGKEKEFSIEKRIKEAKKLGITTLEISGGEPTINKKIFSVLSKIKIAKIDTGLVSNGRMFFYDDFLEKIIALNTNFFFISLHSHKKEVHDFLTNTDGSWGQTVKGIENITNNKKRVDLIINCVVVKQNVEVLDELVLYLKKKKVKQIKFSFPLFMGEMKKNKQIIPSADYAGQKISKAMNLCMENKINCFYEGLPYCLISRKHRFKNHTLENANVYYIFEPRWERFEEVRAKKKYKEMSCLECSYYSSCVYYNGKISPFSPKPILERIPSVIYFKKTGKEFINHPRAVILEGKKKEVYFASDYFFKVKDIKKIKEEKRIFYKKGGKVFLLESKKENAFKPLEKDFIHKEEKLAKEAISSIDGDVLVFTANKRMNLFGEKITTIKINTIFPRHKPSFECVLIFNSYNRIKNLKKDLLKIKEVLAERGKLIIFEKNLIGILGETEGKEHLNYRNQSLEEAVYFIESLGFKTKKKKDHKGFWEIVAEK